ncbi:MAG: hypothetical protein K2Q22_05020, partial [Cytophagales bacterium]|nr:hypothetical protein [Cytophagales bacterium]
YFQTAHLLQAKIRKTEGHHLSDMYIRSAAMFSPDRSQLYLHLNPTGRVKIDNALDERNNRTGENEVVTVQSLDTPTLEPLNPKISVMEERKTSEDVSPKEIHVSEPIISPIPEIASKESKNSAIMDEVLANLQALRDAKKLAQGNLDSVIGAKTIEVGKNVGNDSINLMEDSPKTIVKPRFKVNSFIAPIEYKNQELFDGRTGESTGTTGQLDILQGYLTYLKKSKVLVPEVEEQLSVIESFIKKNPSISKPTEANLAQHKIDFSQKSSKESAELVTENLANIFVKQKKFGKAIEIYQKLSLKYPEKSTYFAQKITELQNL